ncbi:glycoside hydrolase domain-containing protein [Kineococcus sp. R86509]|uniref:glycoside hydrolase domain-containing protein n=1 Tax=Kineococcus sp. R86509 TaxID=3093851 RepID=UPI0036D36EE9
MTRAAHEFLLVDALAKVFPDERPRELLSSGPLTVYAGETASFQVAWRAPSTRDLSDLPRLVLRVDAGPGSRVTLHRVGLVPVLLAAYEGADEHYLRTSPGLYPDPLHPLGSGEPVVSAVDTWSAWWVDVVVEDPERAGPRTIGVVVSTEDGVELFAAEVGLRVHAAVLPDVDVTIAHWLHVDALADRYAVVPFGERHWELLDHHLVSLRAMGGNTLLTPLWTPPLDTAPGGRRTSTQLVRVTLRDGSWSFGFENLDRWAATAIRRGFTTLEMPHLFTQWGAKATPSVTAGTDAGTREVFGWHVPATDPSYREFLGQLVPRLRAHLGTRWPQLRTVWHVSDEPGADALPDYTAARAVVGNLLDGARVVDALSDRRFLTAGAVDVPVVATDAVGPFAAAGDEFWVYHCNAQDRGVSNRFIAQPSWRTRAIGQQLFASGATGFLHWGFNFWNSQLSTRTVDPWQDPSSGGAFPAGDAFVVYPGADGRPVESLRHRALRQAVDDHRALQLLGARVGAFAAARVAGGGTAMAFDDLRPGVEFWSASRREVDRLALGGSPPSR